MKNLDDKNKMFSDNNLSEIEIQEIKRTIRKKVARKNNSNKKIAVAALGVVLVGAGITPVIAENLPKIKEIYENFRITNEYKDYVEYVGETKEFDGGIVTLDNLIITRDKMMISLEVKTDEKVPVDKENKFYVTSNFDEEWDLLSKGFSAGTYRIDDNTFAIEAEIRWEGRDLKENEDLSFIVAYGDNKRVAKFDLKANISSTLNDIYDMDVNKEVHEGTTLDAIESTVLSTKLQFSTDKDYYEYESDIDLHRAILVVDGKYYFVENSSAKGMGDKMDRGGYIAEYRSINSDVLKDAKSIDLIILNTNHERRNIDGNSDKKIKVNYKTEDGLKYPSYIETENGESVEIYNFENSEEEISITLKGDVNESILFARSLYCGSGLNTRHVEIIDGEIKVTFDKKDENHINGFNIGISDSDYGDYNKDLINDTIKIK